MRLVNAERLKEVFHRNVASGEVYDQLIDAQPSMGYMFMIYNSFDSETPCYIFASESEAIEYMNKVLEADIEASFGDDDDYNLINNGDTEKILELGEDDYSIYVVTPISEPPALK